jgi:hypothetical protein
MGRFENENQIREMPTEFPKEGTQQRPAVFTNFLKRGMGLQNQQRQRKAYYAQRGAATPGANLLAKVVLGGQHLILTEQQAAGTTQQQAPLLGARGIESRLLSKAPLRHWGYETAIVRQPEIDQAPNYKRHVKVQRQRASRIHRVRRGVAWDIPVYDRQRHEKGGLAWTIPMDSNFYSGDAAEPSKKKASKSKSKSLLARFTAGVKHVFKGRRATTKGPKYAVRGQQRLSARKRGEPYVTRSSLPPQAPIVEKRRAGVVERTSGLELQKKEAFARAPGVAAAPMVADRGMLMNGRRIHMTHMSEIPLMRQALPLDEDKSAHTEARSASKKPMAQHHSAHTKGKSISAPHEQRVQQVRTG